MTEQELHPIDCDAAMLAVSRRIDDLLDEESTASLNSHLASCANCQAQAASMDRSVLALRQSGLSSSRPTPVLRSGLRDRILSELEAAPAQEEAPIFSLRRLNVAAAMLVVCGIGLIGFFVGGAPVVVAGNGDDAVAAAESLGVNIDELLKVFDPSSHQSVRDLLAGTHSNLEALQKQRFDAEEVIIEIVSAVQGGGAAPPGTFEGKVDVAGVIELMQFIGVDLGNSTGGTPEEAANLWGLDGVESERLLRASRNWVASWKDERLQLQNTTQELQDLPLAKPVLQAKQRLDELLPE